MDTESLLPTEKHSIIISRPVAYAYSRFSTAQQADGDSKRRQDSVAKSWPDVANYEIRYLHDAGISAYDGDNRTIGQFGVFLASLRAGQLGAKPLLLVENLDRISREELDKAQTLFLEIVSLGATIITLHNGKRYAKGMGLVDIITALVEMDVAHQHSAKLSMRVREAVQARRQSGAIIHNRASAPRWLSLDAKRTRFEPVADRVKLVLKMFELAAKGMGPEAVARFFNTNDIPTWSRRISRPGIWRGTTIAQILFGRAVLGEFDGRPHYFGAPVVPLELWQQVNDRTRREAQGRGKGVVTESNLLCGLVVSGVDHSSMVLRQSGVKDRRTGQYVWHRYLVSNLTLAGKSRHRARYERIEALVLWLFTSLDPAMLARAKQGAHSDVEDRLTEARQRVDTLAKTVSKLTTLIVDDPEPSPSLVTKLKEHESKLSQARESYAELKLSASRYAAVPSVPDDLSKPETRRAFRAEIAQWCSHLELAPDTLTVWFGPRHGIRVNLFGDPEPYPHDLDNEERLTPEDIPEIPPRPAPLLAG